MGQPCGFYLLGAAPPAPAVLAHAEGAIGARPERGRVVGHLVQPAKLLLGVALGAREERR
jgi:hypothetical protein